MLLEAQRRWYLARLDSLWLESMKRGQFSRAWRLSDAAVRVRAGLDCSAWPRHRQFIWNGEPLEGRRVLVRCYHGLGDTIQFARLVPLLRSIGARSILWAQPQLIPLLQTIHGIGGIAPLHEGDPDAGYDADVELAELLHVFRITPETLPRNVPYLHIGAPRSRSDKPMMVGLVWRSGDWDPRRCIPSELLLPLAKLKHVRFITFQQGRERARLQPLFESAGHFSSVLHEARALLKLDLLISVDTFAAHLGGALGVPVWLLLHSDPDWRWMRSREDTPWYPTMRLFRQPRPGDWQTVLERVREELGRRAATLTQATESPARS